MSKKRYFKDLGSTASCVMRSVDTGNKFMVFLDTSGFRSEVHGDKPQPKDPPSDNNSSVNSNKLSTKHTGLKPLEVESPPPQSTQQGEVEEDQKVSTSAQYSNILFSFQLPAQGIRDFILVIAGLDQSRLLKQ